MDANPPTDADYAWAAANSAQAKNRSLERRVEELETQMRIVLAFLKTARSQDLTRRIG